MVRSTEDPLQRYTSPKQIEIHHHHHRMNRSRSMKNEFAVQFCDLFSILTSTIYLSVQNYYTCVRKTKSKSCDSCNIGALLYIIDLMTLTFFCIKYIHILSLVFFFSHNLPIRKEKSNIGSSIFSFFVKSVFSCSYDVCLGVFIS